MLISWNTRGLNKKARYLEVAAHLNKQQVSCYALLETRVKINKAEDIRKAFGQHWDYSDNYEHHQNGRIWFMWRKDRWGVHKLDSSDQFLHCEVYHLNGEKAYSLTIVYAQNQLIKRLSLWKDIEGIANNVRGPWMIIGDFNNV